MWGPQTWRVQSQRPSQDNGGVTLENHDIRSPGLTREPATPRYLLNPNWYFRMISRSQTLHVHSHGARECIAAISLQHHEIDKPGLTREVATPCYLLNPKYYLRMISGSQSWRVHSEGPCQYTCNISLENYKIGNPGLTREPATPTLFLGWKDHLHVIWGPQTWRLHSQRPCEDIRAITFAKLWNLNFWSKKSTKSPSWEWGKDGFRY